MRLVLSNRDSNVIYQAAKRRGAEQDRHGDTTPRWWISGGPLFSILRPLRCTETATGVD